MTFRNLLAAATAVAVLTVAGAAHAALVFVGSWRLNDGPTDPVAMSAQQVAAQLFGGDPADFFISTAGDDASEVDQQAWYAVLGLPGLTSISAQNATTLGPFGLSAYVSDPELFAEQDRFVNYAFKEGVAGPAIPEPATWALMIGGFGLTGMALRRRKPTRLA